MHIGSRLKRLREEKNLSQKAVSAGIVSTSHYSNIESGRFEPSNEVLFLLAERLNVPSSYLHRIHEENFKLQKLLMEYERLIAEEKGGIDSFLIKNDSNFLYIASLKQEIMYNVLKYLEHLKLGRISDAQKHYLEEIACIPKGYIADANLSILEKYQYVTGLYFYYERKYAASIGHFKESLHLSTDELMSAKINYNLALAYYHESDYGCTLVYAKQALRLYMDMHCWKECGDCYNLVAALYIDLHELDEAEKYINKGFSILAEEVTNTYGNLYHNLAVIHNVKKEYVQALEMVNRSLEVKKAIRSSNQFSSKKLKIDMLFELKDFETLQICLRQLREEVSNELEEAHLLRIEANMYFSMREYEQYERHMIRCIDLFLENEDWMSLKDVSREFSAYYADQKKYKSAYTYQEYSTRAYRHMMKELKGGEKI